MPASNESVIILILQRQSVLSNNQVLLHSTLLTASSTGTPHTSWSAISMPNTQLSFWLLKPLGELSLACSVLFYVVMFCLTVAQLCFPPGGLICKTPSLRYSKARTTCLHMALNQFGHCGARRDCTGKCTTAND